MQGLQSKVLTYNLLQAALLGANIFERASFTSQAEAYHLNTIWQLFSNIVNKQICSENHIVELYYASPITSRDRTELKLNIKTVNNKNYRIEEKNCKEHLPTHLQASEEQWNACLKYPKGQSRRQTPILRMKTFSKCHVKFLEHSTQPFHLEQVRQPKGHG